MERKRGERGGLKEGAEEGRKDEEEKGRKRRWIYKKSRKGGNAYKGRRKYTYIV